jgi:uncharacterized membrane protein
MKSMAAIFGSLQRTVIAGFVIAVLIVVVLHVTGAKMFTLDHSWSLFAMRWLHIMSGVMWIGLLWYFNFVQTPMMPKIQPPELAGGVTKFIAPQALWWFRWGALATVVTGLLLAAMTPGGYLVNALTLAQPQRAIGIGIWMALIMAFNVWFLIWPNQQKILGLVPATDAEKAKARPIAAYASRFNTMFSIGMLYCMAVQSHG